jgi:hypothetical protein
MYYGATSLLLLHGPGRQANRQATGADPPEVLLPCHQQRWAGNARQHLHHVCVMHDLQHTAVLLSHSRCGWIWGVWDAWTARAGRKVALQPSTCKASQPHAVPWQGALCC